MATADEVALLRKLVGDTDPDAPRFTDAELNTALEEADRCPVPRDQDGFVIDGAVAKRDTYGVAAQLWEDRAMEEETTGTAKTEAARVSAERNGDVSVQYAGAGKQVGTAELTPDRMRTMARRLRKRSCNYTGGARTIAVAAPNGRTELPVRGDLYPSQLVN